MLRIQASSALRASLLAGTAILALAGAGAAQADDVAADGSVGLEEVVVTAQKRATNLQDTPIAISAMSSEDLAARHVQSIADLGDGSVPTLRVAPFFARSSALTLNMRGIGASVDANQPARDQAVGVYVNGVYMGRAQGLGTALYDVERIEVLKGPQGTLFGRNTEGGAVSIVTRAPTGEFGMRTVLGYGNYNGYKAETHVDLPAINNVAIKFDALVSKRDGTMVNPTSTGQPDFNSYDKRGAQIQALWRPTDSFSADYAFDVAYDGTTPFNVQLEKKGALPLPPLMPVQPDRLERALVGVPLPLSEGNTWGHRLTLDWKLAEHLTLKSISSYRKLDQTQFDNGAAALSVYAPNGTFSRISIARVHQNQASEELQLIGSTPQIEYVVGAFYFQENVDDNAQTPNTLQWNATGTGYTTLSVDLNTWPYDRASEAKTTSYGVFAQAVWTPQALNEALHLTLGGRFTRDAKTGSLNIVNGALPSYVDAAKQTIVGVVPLDESWSHFDPLVTLAYDLSDDVNVYARWSTGYKAGGANSRSLIYRPFDPEKVSMAEIGLKSEFWDRRARLNLAVYKGDIKDAQVDFSVIIPGNNRGTLETTNAATGDTKGAEIDFAVTPLEGLTLSAAFAYTDVKLSKAFNPFTGAQATVYPLYTPKTAGSFGVDYVRPLASATLTAHLDAAFADGHYTSTSDPTKSDRYTLVNGRLALSDIDLGASGGKLQLALWSRNLLDEAHAFYRNTSAALGTFAIYNEPRTYGVEAKVEF